MSDDRGHDPDEPLAVLAEEVERWNTQINLVSRVKTRDVIRDLMSRCRSGWELTREALVVSGWPATSHYIDIGTGGGFPGLVWASERRRARETGRLVLVEPRDKRAWFLRRTARAMGLEEILVLQARWGELNVQETKQVEAEAVLISMKALRLDDQEILEGMSSVYVASDTLREIAIVRFLDPVQHDRDWLVEHFAAHRDLASRPWSWGGATILGEGDLRLLLTRYSLP